MSDADGRSVTPMGVSDVMYRKITNAVRSLTRHHNCLDARRC